MPAVSIAPTEDEQIFLASVTSDSMLVTIDEDSRFGIVDNTYGCQAPILDLAALDQDFDFEYLLTTGSGAHRALRTARKGVKLGIVASVQTAMISGLWSFSSQFNSEI